MNNPSPVQPRRRKPLRRKPLRRKPHRNKPRPVKPYRHNSRTPIMLLFWATPMCIMARETRGCCQCWQECRGQCRIYSQRHSPVSASPRCPQWAGLSSKDTSSRTVRPTCSLRKRGSRVKVSYHYLLRLIKQQDRHRAECQVEHERGHQVRHHCQCLVCVCMHYSSTVRSWNSKPECKRRECRMTCRIDARPDRKSWFTMANVRVPCGSYSMSPKNIFLNRGYRSHKSCSAKRGLFMKVQFCTSGWRLEDGSCTRS